MVEGGVGVTCRGEQFIKGGVTRMNERSRGERSFGL